MQSRLLAAALALVLYACAAGPMPVTPSVFGIVHTSCDHFDAEVARFWSDDAKAKVRAGILAAGGNWTQRFSERFEQAMDSATRDWVKAQAGLCKEARRSGGMSHGDYARASLCMGDALSRQRALVEVLEHATPDVFAHTENVLKNVDSDAADCRTFSYYRIFDDAPGDEQTRRARELTATATAQLLVGDVRAQLAADEAVLASAGTEALAPRMAALCVAAWAQAINLRPEAAESQANEALTLARQTGSRMHEANVLSVLGDAFLAGENVRRAQAEQNNYLALQLKERGPDNPGTMSALAGLGQQLYLSGDYWAARSKLESAVTLQERELGVKHPDLLFTYLTLGRVRVAQYDFARAHDALRKALEIGRANFGEAHVSAETTYSVLGDMYLRQGDFVHALESFRKRLEILVDAVGPEHQYTAFVYDELGSAYHQQGELAEALAMRKKALAIRATLQAPYRARFLALSLVNVAEIQRAQGNKDEALALHQEALTLNEQSSSRIGVARSHQMLGALHADRGDFDRAVMELERACPMLEAVFAAENPLVSGCYNDLGIAYRRQGNLSVALTALEKALDLRQRQVGLTHWSIAVFHYNLGVARDAAGQYESALRAHREALAIRTTTYGADGSETQESREAISDLCEKRGYKPACGGL